MTNCNSIQEQLFDYCNNHLSEDIQKEISNHLKQCEDCQKELNEMQIVISAIEGVQDVEPDYRMLQGFLNVLADEKAKEQTSKKIKNIKSIAYPIFRAVAVVVLAFSAFFMGYYFNSNKYKTEITSLIEEKNELKTIATVSLIENESASKRIQGLHYAQEMERPTDAILKVLINKMNYDEHISVRLASAHALAKFSGDNAVVQELIRTLEVEINPTMQLELIEILVDIKEKRAVPVMEKILSDQESPEYLKEQIQQELKHLI